MVAELASFRGAAPLHHTLLSGTEVTGVSLQTLHPSEFDHGIILAQTTPLRHGAETVPDLEQCLAPKGAELLLQGIRDRIFMNNPRDLDHQKAAFDEGTLQLAPKISPADRRIDWQSWTAENILRRQRVIGPLWNHFCRINGESPRQTRLIWSSGFRQDPAFPESIKSQVPSAGRPVVVGLHYPYQQVYVKTCDGHMLQIEDVKLEGERSRTTLKAAQRARLVELPRVLIESPHDFKLFDCTLR